MKKKLVSIIINCLNGEKYLQQAINSVLNQKYKNFEVIFIDNCSNDNSALIYKKVKDKRFKYFKTKKKIKLHFSILMIGGIKISLVLDKSFFYQIKNLVFLFLIVFIFMKIPINSKFFPKKNYQLVIF